MGPLSYMQSIVKQNVLMWRIPVLCVCISEHTLVFTSVQHAPWTATAVNMLCLDIFCLRSVQKLLYVLLLSKDVSIAIQGLAIKYWDWQMPNAPHTDLNQQQINSPLFGVAVARTVALELVCSGTVCSFGGTDTWLVGLSSIGGKIPFSSSARSSAWRAKEASLFCKSGSRAEDRYNKRNTTIISYKQC